MVIRDQQKAGFYTIYLFYSLALLGATLVLTIPNSLLPEFWRIGFLVLSVLPVLYQKNLAIFTIAPMLCVSLASFCPVLPTSSTYYIIVIPIIALFQISIRIDPVMRHTFLVLFYYFIVSLLYGENIGFIYWTIIAIFIVACVKDRASGELLSTAFMITSIGICLLYIFFAQYFLVKIASDAEGGIERSQWLNPNVLSGMIDCGGIIAAGYLTGFLKHGIKSRFFLVIEILTVVLVLVVNFINASRAGTSVFLLMILVFSLFSKAKTAYKALIVIGLAALIIYVYNAGFMDTFLYRMNEGDLGTASGRTTIAITKMNAFFETATPLNLLFGIGQTETNNLGIYASTHNDFVTSLISFGFIGFVLYLSIFYTIIKRTRKPVRTKALVLLSFIVIEAGTQEFFFRGYLCLTLFLFFIYKYFSIETELPQQERR